MCSIYISKEIVFIKAKKKKEINLILYIETKICISQDYFYTNESVFRFLLVL